MILSINLRSNTTNTSDTAVVRERVLGKNAFLEGFGYKGIPLHEIKGNVYKFKNMNARR
jgi:hypothetical protein